MWSSSVPDPSVRRRDDRLEPAVAGTPEKKSRHDTGIARSVKPGERQASRQRRPRLSPRGILSADTRDLRSALGDELAGISKDRAVARRIVMAGREPVLRPV